MMGRSLPKSGIDHRGRFRKLVLRQEFTLLVVAVAIAVTATLRNSSFLDTANLLEILKASVMYFVMACGAAMLMIGGGLDFSVGSVFTFGSLMCASALVAGAPVAVGVLAGIAAGAAMGLMNHLIISVLHAPPIIGTLGTFFVLGGVNTQITGGKDVLPLPDSFKILGSGRIFGFPVVVIYGIVVGIVFWVLLERTRFGLNVRALGGNRNAAIGAGLRITRLDLALYVIGGATAGLAGVIYTARVGAGQVMAGGAPVTLSVVTAVLIGGVSLLGGLGTITGVALGALLLSLIDNALILARISPQYNQIVLGLILISAVAIDYVRRQELYKKR